MEFGDMLKAIRKERSLTQDELASILGTTKQVISRYETKQRVPRLSVVEDYAAKLGVPLSLLSGQRTSAAEDAAPQVGVLRRAVIVLETNVPDDEEEYMIELINPVIVETAGEQTGAEGCLSIPNEFGVVTRPDYVKVRAQDRHGEWFEVEGRGLTARAFCHEIDHLDGVLFIDKAIRMLSPEELEQQAKG